MRSLLDVMGGKGTRSFNILFGVLREMFITIRLRLSQVRGSAGEVKRSRFRPCWLSVYAGSNPVSRISIVFFSFRRRGRW